MTWGETIERISGTGELYLFTISMFIFNIFLDEKTKEFPEVRVGSWNPIFGIVAEDVLFPHVEHRFRNKTLKLLTYHVS